MIISGRPKLDRHAVLTDDIVYAVRRLQVNRFCVYDLLEVIKRLYKRKNELMPGANEYYKMARALARDGRLVVVERKRLGTGKVKTVYEVTEGLFEWKRKYDLENLRLLEEMLKKCSFTNEEMSKRSKDLTMLLLKEITGCSFGGLVSFPTSLPVSRSIEMTLRVVRKFGEVTAGQVSATTGRSRSIESWNLNELYRMGYVKKRRERGKMYFFIE